MISSRLLEAYRNAVYVVNIDGQNYSFAIGDDSSRLLTQLQPDNTSVNISAIFITAHNPMGKILSTELNNLANQKLEAFLRTHNKPYYHGYGQSTDSSWCEDSFLVMGVDESEVEQWCDTWSQNAVLLLISNSPVRLVFHSMFTIEK